MAEAEWITRARKWKHLDPILERDILAAAKDGATLRLQAMAAGISFSDYKAIRALGRDGVRPFNHLYTEVERAMYEIVRPGVKRKVEIMQSPEATISEIDNVAARLVPDDYPERQPGPVGPAAGGMNITVNMIKGFDPIPLPAGSDPNVVEGEVVE